MNAKGQHVLDLTTLVSGVVFIVLAMALFSIVTDELEESKEEENIGLKNDLGMRKFLNTALQTPVEYNNDMMTISELMQKYYYYALLDCDGCEQELTRIDNKLTESFSEFSYLVSDRQGYIQMSLIDTKEKKSYESQKIHIRSPSYNAYQKDWDSVDRVSLSFYSDDSDNKYKHTVFIPLQVPVSVSGYEDFVIGVSPR